MVTPFRLLKNSPYFFGLGLYLLVSLRNDGPAWCLWHHPILYVRENPSVTRYLVSTFAFHFLQVLCIWRGKTRPPQGAPINLAKIYFYFDPSPWVLKDDCRAYAFSVLSVGGKERHFMKAVIILLRYRIHWSKDEGCFAVYCYDGFHLGNSIINFYFWTLANESKTTTFMHSMACLPIEVRRTSLAMSWEKVGFYTLP